MSEPTICSNCTNLRLDGKNSSPWRWTCVRHKRLDGFGWVTDRMLNMPPYLFAKDVNGGACPLFEAGQNEVNQENENGN